MTIREFQISSVKFVVLIFGIDDLGWITHRFSTLRWRRVFWIPVLVFPLAATLVHVVAVVKLDSVKPTDDLHCDSSDPLW